MSEELQTPQWGIRTQMPGGISDVEVRYNRSNALIGFSNAMNGPTRQPIELVWRTVEASQWSDDRVGDQWGVRYTWSDRSHGEVEPRDSRIAAERYIRMYQGPATAELVARNITYGEWTAELTGQPVGRDPAVRAPAATAAKWWTFNYWTAILDAARRA